MSGRPQPPPAPGEGADRVAHVIPAVFVERDDRRLEANGVWLKSDDVYSAHPVDGSS